MTAEVAILNREAVAIAADSAVTFSNESGEKVFTSANKLFTLSKYHPIGVMVFGTATFMKVPWETIIKAYRRRLGHREFSRVEDYAQNFLHYVERARQFTPASDQRYYVLHRVGSYIAGMLHNIRQDFESARKEKPSIPESQIVTFAERQIRAELEEWRAARYCYRASNRQRLTLLRTYRRQFQEVRNGVFEKLPLPKSALRDLFELASHLLVKQRSDRTHRIRSGLVFAGFGRADVFPKCIDYTIEGIAGNRLIGTEGHLSDGKTETTVRPFAQDDVVLNFARGIDPSLRNALIRNLSSILGEYPKLLLDELKIPQKSARRKIAEAKLTRLRNDLVTKFNEKLREVQQQKFVDPLVTVVAMLPKDELASMAETLVNLTSFKRRLSMGPESVAGPVDVAVISKGDGFIWVKRKHYFKPELNRPFFENYFRK